jgi:four helix bundle protein
MATITCFEDLECWQIGRVSTRLLYRLTKKTAFQEDWDLKRQIRRAAVSMTSNIAEGFERDGNKEFINFLSIAKGSAGEVRSQLYVALDECYISETEFSEATGMLTAFASKTAGLLNYLKTCEHKGIKFKSA